MVRTLTEESEVLGSNPKIDKNWSTFIDQNDPLRTWLSSTRVRTPFVCLRGERWWRRRCTTALLCQVRNRRVRISLKPNNRTDIEKTESVFLKNQTIFGKIQLFIFFILFGRIKNRFWNRTETAVSGWKKPKSEQTPKFQYCHITSANTSWPHNRKVLE